MRIAIITLLVAFTACTKQNPNVCCTGTADCAAQGLPDGTTCSQGLVCRGNQCIAETCSVSSECDGAAPYCIMQSCAEMCTDDAQCPGFGQPAGDQFCVSGTCVACRASGNDCPANAAICDMGTCRGCTAHADCASELCDLDSGVCVAESTIAYASPTGSTTGGCTKSAPCKIERAFAVIDTTRNAIKLAPGTYTYLDPDPSIFLPLIVSGAHTLTIYGSASVTAAIQVQDGSTLRVRDVSFVGSTDHDTRLLCGPTAVGGPMPAIDLRRVTVSGYLINGTPCDMKLTRTKISLTDKTSYHPIFANGEVMGMLGATVNRGSTVTIDQSEIDGGFGGIYVLNYSALQMTNSIIRNQGTHGAIFLGTKTSPSSVSFSTFYNTFWACPDGAAIWTSKNNIFFNESAGGVGNTLFGTQCVHSYNMVKPQTATPTGSNNTLGMDPRFKNATNGDFHILVGSPAIDAADPAATEAVDYDGTSRPQGARRDIGAFEYKP